MEYIQKQMLTDTIYINPKDINIKNINGLILVKLKQLRENKCNSNGIILQNSIKFVSKRIGKVSSIDTSSKIVYNIRYECEIINPTIGNKIECYIDNISKMGIIAYIKMNSIIKDYIGSNTLEDSPLIIIVPNEDVIQIDKLQVNDKINVDVIASRIKFNANKIQIIGKIQ
jgi:hypothetical protein